jgi:hypothetical protein
MTFSMDNYNTKKSELESQKVEAEATFDGGKLGEIEQSLLKLEQEKSEFEKLSSTEIPQNFEDRIVEQGGTIEELNEKTKEVDIKIERVKEGVEEKVEGVENIKDSLENIQNESLDNLVEKIRKEKDPERKQILIEQRQVKMNEIQKYVEKTYESIGESAKQKFLEELSQGTKENILRKKEHNEKLISSIEQLQNNKDLEAITNATQRVKKKMLEFLGGKFGTRPEDFPNIKKVEENKDQLSEIVVIDGKEYKIAIKVTDTVSTSHNLIENPDGLRHVSYEPIISVKIDNKNPSYFQFSGDATFNPTNMVREVYNLIPYGSVGYHEFKKILDSYDEIVGIHGINTTMNDVTKWKEGVNEFRKKLEEQNNTINNDFIEKYINEKNKFEKEFVEKNINSKDSDISSVQKAFLLHKLLNGTDKDTDIYNFFRHKNFIDRDTDEEIYVYPNTDKVPGSEVLGNYIEYVPK